MARKQQSRRRKPVRPLCLFQFPQEVKCAALHMVCFEFNYGGYQDLCTMAGCQKIYSKNGPGLRLLHACQVPPETVLHETFKWGAGKPMFVQSIIIFCGLPGWSRGWSCQFACQRRQEHIVPMVRDMERRIRGTILSISKVDATMIFRVCFINTVFRQQTHIPSWQIHRHICFSFIGCASQHSLSNTKCPREATCVLNHAEEFEKAAVEAQEALSEAPWKLSGQVSLAELLFASAAIQVIHHKSKCLRHQRRTIDFANFCIKWQKPLKKTCMSYCHCGTKCNSRACTFASEVILITVHFSQCMCVMCSSLALPPLWQSVMQSGQSANISICSLSACGVLAVESGSKHQL